MLKTKRTDIIGSFFVPSRQRRNVQDMDLKRLWLRGQDSNLRSEDYETSEITSFSTPLRKYKEKSSDGSLLFPFQTLCTSISSCSTAANIQKK
jgi:hypothetical protein